MAKSELHTDILHYDPEIRRLFINRRPSTFEYIAHYIQEEQVKISHNKWDENPNRMDIAIRRFCMLNDVLFDTCIDKIIIYGVH